MSILKLPQQEPRVESGPVQFGDDWPGTFIRGDEAFNYRLILEGILRIPEIPKEHRLQAELDGLIDLLDSCNVHEQLKRKPIENPAP